MVTDSEGPPTMTMYPAKKVIIITEKLIADKVAKTAQDCGAKGYTVTAAGGKGERGVRAHERASIAEDLCNVKIEIIVSSIDVAKCIAHTVREKYLSDYAGLIYLQDVEVMRPQKF
jgi:nitrogen regulatory protein PII